MKLRLNNFESNYQKITTHFANHLKDSDASDESIELIQKVFQLENEL